MTTEHHYRPNDPRIAVTPEVSEKLLDLISSGVTVRNAAIECGIVLQTVWKHTHRVPQFGDLLQCALATGARARAEAVQDRMEDLSVEVDQGGDLRHLDTKVRMADVRSRHVEWYAERMNPAIFGAKSQLAITGPDTAASIESAWNRRIRDIPTEVITPSIAQSENVLNNPSSPT
jgi:hypothetical protein